MDPSIVGIELRCLGYIGKFYCKELFCWKLTNVKMFILSSTTLIGLIACTSVVDNPVPLIALLFGLFTTTLCTSLELCGLCYRIAYLHEFYLTNVIDPELDSELKFKIQ